MNYKSPPTPSKFLASRYLLIFFPKVVFKETMAESPETRKNVTGFLFLPQNFTTSFYTKKLLAESHDQRLSNHNVCGLPYRLAKHASNLIKKEEREECLRSFAGLEKSKSKLPRREERHMYFKI
jgi:hypothetical protein